MNDDIKKLEDRIKAVQRSSKTTFNFLFSANEYLRLKYPFYYNWHLNPEANKVNIVVTAFISVVIALFTTFSVVFPFLSAQATTTWTQSTNADFSAGTTSNTVVSGDSVVLDGETYNYQRNITVDNTGGGALTDYQVKIDLTSGNFDFTHTQSNGEDIRFIDNDNVALDYWIEAWDNVSQTARVWVKIPSIAAASNHTIKILYGNGAVTSGSSGANTFKNFDDFDDLNDWTVSGNTVSVSNSIVTIDNTDGGSSYPQIVQDFSVDTSDYIAEAKYQQPTVYRNRAYLTDSGGGCPFAGDYGMFDISIYWNGWTGVNLTADTWYTLQWLNTSSNYTWNVIDGSDSTVLTRSVGSKLANLNRWDFTGTENTNSDFKLDWVRIRTYSLVEPSTSIGSESSSSQYLPGDFVSSAYDTIQWPDYVQISWDETLPSGTDIKFQIRTATTEAGLTSATWYGPTGTSDYYTNNLGENVNSIHSGDKWVQYKAYLATDSTNNPSLNSVSISYDLQDITIDSNTTWSEGTYLIGDLTIENGATLTLEGGTTVTVTGNLDVDDSAGGSNIVCEGKNVAADSGGEGCVLSISGDAIVDASSTINADGQGYSTYHGPGRALTYTSGASHGGLGEAYSFGTYGDPDAPTDLGSGGGGAYGGWANGGGAINLTVNGTLTVNGLISANAVESTSGNRSGASGGSVYVTTNGLTGSGYFSAAGSSGAGLVPGGGGRVAVYYDSSSADNAMYINTESAADADATAGSAIFYDTSGGIDNYDLYVYKVLRYDTEDETYNLNNIYVGGLGETGYLEYDGGATINLSGDLQLAENNTTILCKGKNTDQDSSGAGCVFNVDNDVTLAANTFFTADAQGYITSHGPGKGDAYTNGASYGGLGENYSNGKYPSIVMPTDLGSAGGGASGGASYGGGAIKINATGNIINNGVISANGEVNGSGNTGGSSGGSVYLISDSLSGSGSITADGSAGTNSDGGGGRIALYYNDISGYSGTYTAAAGGAGATVGSVLLIQDYNLTISSDAEFDTDAIDWNSITVDSGAILTINGGLNLTTNGLFKVTGNSTVLCQATNTDQDSGGVGTTLTAQNLQVDAGSIISADAQGYITSHGPGKGDTYNNGASYGGLGENYSNGIYGEEYSPTDLGSGGGGAFGGWSYGGGAIRINVSGTSTNNGEITADGQVGGGGNTGGSSGGSIYLTTDILAGNGTFSTNGVAGTNADGAGGRQALYYYTSGNCSNFTRTSSAGGVDAEDGTVVCGMPNASYLKFTTGSTTQTAGVANTIALTAYDQYGNIYINYDGSKDITFSGANVAPDGVSFPTVNATNFGSTTTIGFTDGVGSSASMLLYKAENAEIEATDGSVSTEGDPSYDLNVNVNDAGGDHVDFTNSSGIVTSLITQSAGVAISDLYVSALDAYDNVDTNYASGNINIAGGDSNAPGNAPDGTVPNYPDTALSWGVDDVNGVMYFDASEAAKSVTLFARETSRQIKADDSLLADKNSNSFDINAGAIDHYDLSVSSPQTAGTGFSGTVTAKDSYLNTVTSDSSTQLTPSDTGNSNFYQDAAYLIPVSNYTLSSGVATLYIKDTVAENTVYSVIDSNSKTGSTGSITINPASASQIQISNPTNAVAGSSFSVTFRAKDPYGNTDTSYNGSLSLSGLNTAPDGTTAKYGTGNFSSGLVNRTIVGYASGLQKILATSGSISATSSNITISPKALNSIRITPSDNQIISQDQTKQFSAVGYDQYNNARTGDSFVWNNASSSGLFTGTQSGDYQVYAASGSILSNKVTVTVLDTKAPDKPTLNNQDGQIFDISQPTFSGTGEPNLQIIINIDGVGYASTIDGNGNWQYKIPDELADGDYQASFKVRDDAGNDSEEVKLNFVINTGSDQSTTNKLKSEIKAVVDNVSIDVIKIDNGTSGDGALAVLPLKEVTFKVTPDKDKKVVSVIGYFENQQYEFKDLDGDGVYEYQLATPYEKGEYLLKVVVTYDDGQISEEQISITVDPFGYVYTINLDGEQRIENAEVTCWKLNDQGDWEVWQASDFNQENPQLTPSTGEYNFFVPEGIYKLTSIKAGYHDYESADFVVDKGKPVNINILMSKTGFAGAVSNIAKAYLELKENIEPIVQSSGYQAGVATANSVSALVVGLGVFLPFVLNFGLMSSPLVNLWLSLMAFLGLAKKTKNPWGVVYDTESKQPIADAIVQIYNARYNKLLETTKTDVDGRFAFLVDMGVYYLKVHKNDYTFPSKIDDQSYDGDTFKVYKTKITDMRIGLDPDFKVLNYRANLFSKMLNVVDYIRIPLLIIGTILSLGNYIVFTTTLNAFILLLYVIVWAYEAYRTIKNVKTFGNVYDRNNKHGLDLAIMRVFNSETNKLVATKVTNMRGNYNVLIPKGKYKTLITKQQYQQYNSNTLNFSKGEAITKDYGLDKNSK